MTAHTMELSFETPDDAFLTFRKSKIDTLCPPSTSCQFFEETDIIDSTKLNFSNDEIWLCESTSRSDIDLQKWLYDDDPNELKSKNIDTRTFTRPKKRFTRPSIEKYNEELYGNDLKESTDSGIQLNGYSQDDSPSKPLHFDLGQTTASVYFENILANAPVMDSFQNMSPPSLVNSMCSSTFANLMESSFIKNDPVLREIRDTDFTVSILQQETEPMFQSISESFSSLNSDVPENFLKKVSFTEKDLDTTLVLNATFKKDDEDIPCDRTVILDTNLDDFQEAKELISDDLNTTYQCKSNSTIIQPLNSTFQRRKTRLSTIQDLNSTVTIEPEKTIDRTYENVKRLLDRRPSPSLDLNRLSYLVDKNDQMNATFTNDKRNSFGSTDSGENLDYMSLSSGSSKSSRLPSTDGINLIDNDVKFSNTFRKSGLQQIMSTPKPRTKTPNLFANNEISPIQDRNSDPELSSIEQAQTVIQQNSIRKQRSFGHINQKFLNQKVETKTIRGSHPNLKMPERTYGLQRSSNLNSMGHALKGSYTSLRPTNTNLPVAPPPLDTTITKTPTVAQVPPLLKEVPKFQDAQFVKPQPPRSGLPRPVTGIPRPVSRIPAPKGVRSGTKSAGYQGRH